MGFFLKFRIVGFMRVFEIYGLYLRLIGIYGIFFVIFWNVYKTLHMDVVSFK